MKSKKSLFVLPVISVLASCSSTTNNLIIEQTPVLVQSNNKAISSMILVEGNKEIKSFYISKYEVTQEEYISVMISNPSFSKGKNLPVENVSWNDAMDFVEAKNKKEGLQGKNAYRLPTSKEWQYAASGGNKSKGFKFSGSNNIKEVAVTRTESSNVIGSKKPNELGIFDMTGNVSEWTITSPKKEYRLICGGSWADYTPYLEIDYLTSFTENYKSKFTGIRLVKG